MNTSSRPPLLGIRHVALFARDLETAERFWVDVMGYEVEWRPDADNLYLALRGDSLALHRADTIAPRGSLDHLGIAYSSPGDVDTVCQRLAAAGTRVVEPPRQHRDGAYSATLLDPEGNHLQLIYHPPIVAFEKQR